MNKYILVKNHKDYIMKFANTDFHRDMVGNNDIVFGGGMFTLDYEKEEMLLWGKSSDYGAPRFNEIEDKIHTDEDMSGWKIILGNIYPSLEEEQRLDITDRFIFDE